MGSLQSLSSVLQSPAQRPDIIQLMMSNYAESLATGISIAQGISGNTGYPVSNFRFGIKPQCGVHVGSASYLVGALPALVESGAGIMLWNMGRDYPCSCHNDCSEGCAQNSLVGQQAFSSSAPFAFTCAISRAFDADHLADVDMV